MTMRERIGRRVVKGKGRVFFSEEEKQKTFTFCSRGTIPAMAGILGAAETA
jgi:hypothetical protein